MRKLKEAISVRTGLATGQTVGQASIRVDHQKEKKPKKGGQGEFGEQALIEQNWITRFLEPKPVHPQTHKPIQKTK